MDNLISPRKGPNTVQAQPKQVFLNSVMSYITLSLATILGITLLSIFISFWVTELADNDAQAINLSGSMRMQTYYIVLALERGDVEQVMDSIDTLHNTWNHPLFSAQHAYSKAPITEHDALTQRFNYAYQHWMNVVKPALMEDIRRASISPETEAIMDAQVAVTDALVNEFQRDAEAKIINLRSFQLIAFLITMLVGSLIFYLLKNRIEKPLLQLTDTARKLAAGDFSQRVSVDGRDELALLSSTFNQMSESIGDSYAKLEDRVDVRTKELKQNNIALNFLFNTAKEILESNRNSLDFQAILDELSDVLNGRSLELCLFTEQGDKPYMKLIPTTSVSANCAKEDCRGCRNLMDFKQTMSSPGERKFPIAMEERHYGIIDLELAPGEELPAWQQSLVQSVANQFAIALSLTEQKDQEYRYAMLSERTVIARELHDSLAQALSYLQIQVTRLQKSHDKEKWEMQQPIIDELREGLSSAYRQLRELLTTFRLKMDKGGLRGALETTVTQLQERTEMRVSLDYQVDDIPLAPGEEIHLLQIVREACQNAIHHSKGDSVSVCLKQQADKTVELIIEDDGVGIPTSPEKLNHYGLAIMTERSRNLGGSMNIALREEGGTRVNFSFTPSVQNT
ncbi:MAG: HAMP domain-containing protein [Agarilytica sp.]